MMAPAVVIRPIRFAPHSVNHRLPSGPDAMPNNPPGSVGIGNSVTIPAGVIRPIQVVLPVPPVNHTLPSGPAAISKGSTRRRKGYSDRAARDAAILRRWSR